MARPARCGGDDTEGRPHRGSLPPGSSGGALRAHPGDPAAVGGRSRRGGDARHGDSAGAQGDAPALRRLALGSCPVGGGQLSPHDLRSAVSPRRGDLWLAQRYGQPPRLHGLRGRCAGPAGDRRGGRQPQDAARRPGLGLSARGGGPRQPGVPGRGDGRPRSPQRPARAGA